jgi:hypothetical protein
MEKSAQVPEIAGGIVVCDEVDISENGYPHDDGSLGNVPATERCL